MDCYDDGKPGVSVAKALCASQLVQTFHELDRLTSRQFVCSGAKRNRNS